MVRLLLNQNFVVRNLNMELEYFESDNCSGRPCGLNIKVAGNGKNDWAILQVYEEIYQNGICYGPFLDNDKCSSVAAPFYSASRCSPWSGQYADQPADRFTCDGRLTMYTSVCEVDLNGKSNQPDWWKYHLLYSITWGFEKKVPNNVTCLPLKRQTSLDQLSKFQIITSIFPNISIK